LDPNVTLSTQFSNTLGLGSSRLVRHEVSRPWKIREKIIVSMFAVLTAVEKNVISF
jgi:hypothetical protein